MHARHAHAWAWACAPALARAPCHRPCLAAPHPRSPAPPAPSCLTPQPQHLAHLGRRHHGRVADAARAGRAAAGARRRGRHLHVRACPPCRLGWGSCTHACELLWGRCAQAAATARALSLHCPHTPPSPARCRWLCSEVTEGLWDGCPRIFDRLANDSYQPQRCARTTGEEDAARQPPSPALHRVQLDWTPHALPSCPPACLPGLVPKGARCDPETDAWCQEGAVVSVPKARPPLLLVYTGEGRAELTGRARFGGREGGGVVV